MSEDKTQPAEAIAELAARLVEQVGGPVHEEILLIAEKVGELSDRFAKIEGEFTAQTAPLDAAKANQDASLVALNAAIEGIKALNFHVLDNNLGAVSKRVDVVAEQAGVAVKSLEDRLSELAQKAEQMRTALEQKIAQGDAQRTELARARAEDAKQLEAKVGEVRQAIEWAQKTLADEIALTRKEFAEPKSLNPRGKYDAQATYARLDVVTINGTSYISTEDGNAEKPSKASRKWQVLASRGGSAAIGGGATDITGVAGMGATGLQLAQAGTEDEARTILGVADVVGATADDDGEAGRVPQPDAGEQGYFLRGDGTWAAASVVTAALATESDARAGTDNEKYISPLTGNARALQGDMTRKISDVLFSDGATSNRRGEATFGAAGAVAGMAVSISFEFTVPATIGTEFVITGIGPALPNSASVNTLLFFISSGGELRLHQTGAAPSDYRRLAWAAFRATYSGQFVRGMLVFPAGDSTTSPVITLFGADVSSSFTLATNGTPPNWMPTTLDTTRYTVNLSGPAGRFVPHAPILGALTAAEVLEWTQTGRLPTWCEVGTGSAVAAYTSDFSAGADSFTGSGATKTGNIDGVTDGYTSKDNTLLIQATATTGTHFAYRDSVKTWERGRRYRVTLDYLISSASQANLVAQLFIGGGRVTTDASTGASAIMSTRGTWTTLSVIVEGATTNPSRLQILFSNGAGSFTATIADEMWLANIKVYDIGPLAKWEIQPVATCYDAGSNKIPLLLTAGITPVTNRRDWVLQGQTTTNGNQQLLGASVFVAPYDYTRHMLDSAEVNGTSTATVGVGSASGGAQYVTAAAIASGRNRRTLVTPVPGTANIWISSNATDTLQHTIRGHIVD